MNTYIMIIFILLLIIAVLTLFYSILKLNKEISESTNDNIENVLRKDDNNIFTQKTEETKVYYDIGDRMAALNKDKEVKKDYIKVVCNNCNKETDKDNIVKCDKCGKECCIYCSEEEVTLDLDKNSTRTINICKECSEE